jgi:hypothetical protein
MKRKRKWKTHGTKRASRGRGKPQKSKPNPPAPTLDPLRIGKRNIPIFPFDPPLPTERRHVTRSVSEFVFGGQTLVACVGWHKQTLQMYQLDKGVPTLQHRVTIDFLQGAFIQETSHRRLILYGSCQSRIWVLGHDCKLTDSFLFLPEEEVKILPIGVMEDLHVPIWNVYEGGNVHWCITHPESDSILFIDSDKRGVWIWKLGDLVNPPILRNCTLLLEILDVNKKDSFNYSRLHIRLLFLSPTKIWVYLDINEMHLDDETRWRAKREVVHQEGIEWIWDTSDAFDHVTIVNRWLVLDENHLYDTKHNYFCSKPTYCRHRDASEFASLLAEMSVKDRISADGILVRDGRIRMLSFFQSGSCTSDACSMKLREQKWCSYSLDHDCVKIEISPHGWSLLTRDEDQMSGWLRDPTLEHPWIRIRSWLHQMAKLPMVLTDIVLDFYKNP